MRPWTERLGPAAGLLLCCSPLFVLTLRGWSNGVLFVGALLSLVLLLWGQLPRPEPAPRDDPAARWMTVALVAPIVAIGISALSRGDPSPALFDSASRFLLGVPIFLFVRRAGVDPARTLRWVLPLALLVALVYLEVDGRDPHWPMGRDTTRLVDPLVFGYLTLAFGLMCLMLITPRRDGERGWALPWCALGVLLGLYLSLRSGSRTGWLAAPLVIGLWLYLQWGRRHRLASAAVLTAACATPVAAFLLVPTIHDRVSEAWVEVAQYSFSGVAPVTSLGMRITFLRIAGDLVAAHPWTGIGDTSRIPVALLPSFDYASSDVVRAAFQSAFHNQVVSNTVRAGVAGFVATVLLLLVPLAVCARQLHRSTGAARDNAALGLAFTLCMVVSSLSTEVVDLKFLASLYSVMVAILCGAALGAPLPRVEGASA